MANRPNTRSATSSASRSPPAPASKPNKHSTGCARSTSSSIATAPAASTAANAASSPVGSTKSSKLPAPSSAGSEASPPLQANSPWLDSRHRDEAGKHGALVGAAVRSRGFGVLRKLEPQREDTHD